MPQSFGGVDEVKHRGSAFRGRRKSHVISVTDVEIADAMPLPPQAIGRLTILQSPVIAATDQQRVLSTHGRVVDRDLQVSITAESIALPFKGKLSIREAWLFNAQAPSMGIRWMNGVARSPPGVFRRMETHGDGSRHQSRSRPRRG